jgi:hypothetical protein
MKNHPFSFPNGAGQENRGGLPVGLFRPDKLNHAHRGRELWTSSPLAPLGLITKTGRLTNNTYQ